MSCIKNPEEKKRQSFERDHRVFALEGNKSYRSGWRLKKALANRRFRQNADIALTDIDQDGEAPPTKPVKQPKSLRKCGVVSLSQSVVIKSGDIGSRWGYIHRAINPQVTEARFGPKLRRAKASLP